MIDTDVPAGTLRSEWYRQHGLECVGGGRLDGERWPHREGDWLVWSGGPHQPLHVYQFEQLFARDQWRYRGEFTVGELRDLQSKEPSR